MANSNGDGSTDSWPGFLSELTKSFLILRDIFGYALPGAVFLSIGLLCRRFSLQTLHTVLFPYDPPLWALLLLALAACYTTGHVMAQLAYIFYDTWKIPESWRRVLGKTRAEPQAKSQNETRKTEAHTQVAPELMILRESHPALLTEYDRQSVMSQLRGSTGAAMLAGSLVFYVFPTPSAGGLVGFAGAFMLLVFWFSGVPHIDELKQRTIQAGTKALEAEPAETPRKPGKVRGAE